MQDIRSTNLFYGLLRDVMRIVITQIIEMIKVKMIRQISPVIT